jgi:pyridoxamine 5'-phosphate oxidase
LSQIRHLGHAPEEPAIPAPLRIEELERDPLVLFDLWLEHALAEGVRQPLGMTLATATPDGRPSARIVLLRGLEDGGFVFYTNYQSRKGEELAKNPRGALVWWWCELGQQIRAEGVIEKVSSETSDAYFQDRPRGSQVAAVISDQSAVIPDKEILQSKWRDLEDELLGGPVPRPDFWGGYRLTPVTMEFWQEGANRLHDRILYVRDDASGPWRLERLAP